MKFSLSTLLILIFTISMLHAQNSGQAGQEVIALSEPVEETDLYRVYGVPFETNGNPLPIGVITADVERYDGQRVVASGTIKQVCLKKGCFFMLETEQGDVRITFRDYSFFIPTDSAGNEVVVEGIFATGERTEEEAIHYAEDAGRDGSEIEGAQRTLELVAASVKIFDGSSE